VEYPEAAEHFEVTVAVGVVEVLGPRRQTRSKPIVLSSRMNCGLIVRVEHLALARAGPGGLADHAVDIR